MVLTIVLALLAGLSLVLLAWQTLAAWRFPLHRRESDSAYAPPVLILKPLKGCDEQTRACLASWMTQEYRGDMRVLFGVADADDPVCAVVRELIGRHPNARAQLVFTPLEVGPNAKISNVAQLYDAHAAQHETTDDQVICLSDADVRVPADFLAQAVQPLRDSKVGLVTSLYQFANPANFAMDLEAVGVNADFWSQVLQSNTLKPQDFALGAVMMTRREQIKAVGGFATLAHYLADDFQLGNRVAKAGWRVALTTIVAECWDAPMTLKQVWAHQVRWARTIRISQPVPYFFSILNNVTLWVTAFAIGSAAQGVYRIAKGYPWHMDALWIALCLVVWDIGVLSRFAAAQLLWRRLTARALPWSSIGVVIAKDFFQVAVWAAAFMGSRVQWRGRTFKVQRDGKLVEVPPPKPA